MTIYARRRHRPGQWPRTVYRAHMADLPPDDYRIISEDADRVTVIPTSIDTANNRRQPTYRTVHDLRGTLR